MNLSQDEINALLTGSPPDAEDDVPVDIMSPEDIAAMLDGNASASVAENEPEPVEIMSPEAIAAMLDGTSVDVPADNGVDVLDDLLARAGGGVPTGDTEVGVGGGFPPLLAKEGMLTEEEVDILGEVGNISMGAVATTMYSLLDRRVSITTPRVSVFDAKDVLSVYRIPFVVATIEYVEGISGTNLLVLKIEDAALITDLLMGGEGKVEPPIELNEMHLSAMSEIMNQMMGASSTSLSRLLQKTINISPPKSSQVDVGFNVAGLLGDIDMVTKISFDMEIENLLKSELIQLIPYDVSREFAKQFMEVGMGLLSGETEPAAAQAPPPSQPAMQPAPPPPQQPAAQPVMPPPYPQQPYPPQPQPQPPQAGAQPFAPPFAQPPPAAQPYPQPYAQEPYQQMPYQQAPFQPPYPGMPYPQYPMAPYPPAAASGRLVDVHPMQLQAFDSPGPVGEQKSIDLVYNIPLQVAVELGKTKKEISEILEFSTGTIIVLDKIAGDPVEIVVNGKLIARGEVVVIDENYGVRITAIING